MNRAFEFIKHNNEKQIGWMNERVKEKDGGKGKVEKRRSQTHLRRDLIK